MSKLITKVIVLLLGVLMLALLSIPAGASVASKQVGVDVKPNGPDPNTSDITVQWLFAAGDVLRQSVDGTNWAVVTPTSNGLATVQGVPNWSILYFQLTDSGSNVTKFTAYPPNINAHDTYASNTSMCAGCHVTHAASGPKLLKEPVQKALNFDKKLKRTCEKNGKMEVTKLTKIP